MDNDTKKYLIPEHPVTPIIYILPKIHKDPLNPPGCPIVSSTDSISIQIATFLDRCLTPLIETMQSYIRDTQHFLHKICNIVLPPGSVLVTWDLANLYTAIPYDLGIEACRRLLIPSRKYTSIHVTFLIQFLSIVLEKKLFFFKDNILFTAHRGCDGL